MEILILLGLILINGLFVMSEIALVSARKARLESMANKGDELARRALELSYKPEVFLSAAQIGITLIAILTGVYSGERFSVYLVPFFKQISFLSDYAEGISITIVVVIVTFLSILFGELIPKRFGLLRAEKIAKMVAGPMYFFAKMTHPLVWLLNKISNGFFFIFNIKKSTDDAVTEEEIKTMISEGTEAGTIEEEEREIIERVFHLGDRNITSLMTHRTDIVWFDINEDIVSVKNKIEKYLHSVYPLCDGDIDNIKGVVYIKDMFLQPDAPLSSLLKKALIVPENNSAYQLLEKF